MNPTFTLPVELSPLTCREVVSQAWYRATTGEPLLNSASDIAERWLNKGGDINRYLAGDAANGGTDAKCGTVRTIGVCRPRLPVTFAVGAVVARCRGFTYGGRTTKCAGGAIRRARLKHGYSRVRYGRCRHFPVSFTARSRPGGSVTVVTLRHSSQS